MRRLFIQFTTVLTLVLAPIVSFASPLVSPAWLSEKLDDNNVVVIDLRNKIDNGSYETFPEGTSGAIHSDYLKEGWRVAVMVWLVFCQTQNNFSHWRAVWVCLMALM